MPCQYWYDNKWYDLTDVSNSSDNIKSTPNGADAGSTPWAAYNFCRKVNQATDYHTYGCTSEDATNAFATIIFESTKSCSAASTDDYDSIASVNFMDSNGGETLGLQYTNNDSTPECSLLVGLICNKDMDGMTTTGLEDVVSNTACSYKTTLTSADVCPSFDLNALWTFLDEYSYIWGVLFIVGGIFLGFLGRKLFKAAVFMVTAILVVFAILLLFYTTFLEDTTEEWVGWTVLVCSILIGLVAGFFMMKLERVGAALLAGWGGFLIGVMLNEMVLYKAESQALFWCMSIGCALVAAVLSFFFYEHVLINMTAFGGAYMLIRGISFYAGGFPNEFTLADQLKAGDTSAFTNWFYLYMVCIIIVAVVCSVVQYKTNNRDEKSPYQKLT